MLVPWKESNDKPRQHIKNQRCHFETKVHLVNSIVFSSSHVWIWDFDHREGWELKNRCFWTVVLEKTLESPWDSREIKPVNSKGNQPLIFIGRTDSEVETLILWPPDAKSWLFGRDPDAGNDWRQKEKGQQRMRWLNSITNLTDKNLSKLWEIVKDRRTWYGGHKKSDTT